jgi:hypothetical protein
MSEQIVNTGDPDTDKMIAEQIRDGMMAGGLSAEIVPAKGGGLCVRAALPAPVQAVAAAPASGVSAEQLQPGAYDLGGPQGFELKQQVQEGDFKGLRKLLADTYAAKQWEDRYFMTDVVIGNALAGSLDEAIAKEPKAFDLRFLRGAHAVYRAWQARGGGTADQVSDEQWDEARRCVEQAIEDLKGAAVAFAGDPTPFAFMMNGMLIFSELEDEVAAAYKEATTRASDFSAPYWFMVNQRARKWGGSHEKSLAVARAAAAHGHPGSDAHACLFRAHLLVWQYAKAFEQDEATATAYFARPDVRQELERAFDAWTEAPYEPRRYSIPKLHWAAFWFFRTGDRARLKRAMSAINNVVCEMPWGWEEGGMLVYTQAMQQAMLS